MRQTYRQAEQQQLWAMEDANLIAIHQIRVEITDIKRMIGEASDERKRIVDMQAEMLKLYEGKVWAWVGRRLLKFIWWLGFGVIGWCMTNQDKIKALFVTDKH